MECIVHYPNLMTYIEKEISENNIERIQLAKEKRLRIGGRNQHPQCDQIPDVISKTKHNVHLERYKTYYHDRFCFLKKSIYYLHLKILLQVFHKNTQLQQRLSDFLNYSGF